MNFIPIEYDFHPEFHTYGMNSASMTFIPTAVRIVHTANVRRRPSYRNRVLTSHRAACDGKLRY